MSTPRIKPADNDLLGGLLDDLRDTPQPQRAPVPPPAPVPPRRTGRKESAIVTQAQLDAARPRFERLVGFALLLLSFFGTIAMCDGGWSRLAAIRVDRATLTPLLPALLGGLLLQGFCTAVEWLYRQRRFSGPYLLAFALDTGSTMIGYYAVLAAPLLRLGDTLGLAADSARLLSYVLIGVAAMVLAFLPEHLFAE